VVEGVVIGAGDRGARAYVSYLRRHPGAAGIVGVAEPDPVRRERFARRHGIPAEACFPDHRELLQRPRKADFALIATGDALHLEPAVLAMERGYHVLLEKPMALCEEDCRRLVEVAERTGRILQVCHVLRYAPFFQALARIVRSGELGQLVTIQHSENVSYWHYAHSYCRGHWRNVADSSPMILAKCCHDLDLLGWLAGSPPARLTSLSRPTLLCAENAPQDAPLHCIEGCPHARQCPYDAVAMYLESAPLSRDLALSRTPAVRAALLRLALAARSALAGLPLGALREALAWRGWPVSAISEDRSPAGVEHALRHTRWGRCVYRVGDNDQVASQSVSVLFRNGVNANFTLHSTSYREGREIRIDGTRGSAVGVFRLAEQRLRVHDHKTGRRRTVRLPRVAAAHGGGDWRLFEGFLAAVRGDAPPQTDARESLQSHLMAFAADRAAREGVVMEWRETKGRAGFQPVGPR